MCLCILSSHVEGLRFLVFWLLCVLVTEMPCCSAALSVFKVTLT